MLRWRPWHRFMPSGQQATAGQGMDRSGMALIQQGDHGIHGGQAGPYQQNRIVRRQTCQRVRGPGIGAVERGVVEGGIVDRHRLRRKIARREDDKIRLDAPVPVQCQHQRP